MADHVLEKQPIIESLGGRPRSSVTPPRVRSKLKRFLGHLGRELYNDNITDIGAMMAYYAILSLFPMLVFIVTLALIVLPQDSILQGLSMATGTMPSATREVVSAQVVSLMNAADAGFAIGGAAIALWGASRGANSLSGALNAMFNKEETRPWWKRQLIAIAVTLGVALLVVVALALLVVGPIAGHWIADRFGLGDVFDMGWNIGRWVGAGLLVMVVWAAVYKFLPNTNAPFRVFTPGAIAGVVLWLSISYGFGFYLSHFDSYTATYGALGGAIIFLTWLWLSNIALLFGAEINDVLADLRKHDSPAAAQLAHDNEAPDHVAPDRDAPDGKAADGSAPDGKTADGSAPDGEAADGSAPAGEAAGRSPPDGKAADRSAPDRGAPDRGAPDRGAPDRRAPGRDARS